MKKIKVGDALYAQEFSPLVFGSSGFGRTFIGRVKKSGEDEDLLLIKFFPEEEELELEEILEDVS